MKHADMKAIALAISFFAASVVLADATEEGPWQPAERWRGFNIYDRIYDENDFHESDIRFVRDFGFNFVRVTLNYRHWIKDGDWNAIDGTKFGEIDKIVGWGRKYGVHVQLCFHRAPGWCVCTQYSEPANLFKDEEAQRVCERHWRHFAERYRDVPPEALSFNLVNEPGSCTEAEYAAFAKRMISAIREVSPRRFIMSDGLGSMRAPCAALIGIPGVGQATRGYQPGSVCLPGEVNGPPPHWPYNPDDPIGNLFGPAKRALHGSHPFVLLDLPPGTLGVAFGRQSGTVTYAVLADGEPVGRYELTPKKDDPQWEQYVFSETWHVAAATYRDRHRIKLERPVKRLEIMVEKGDWGGLATVAFKADVADAKPLRFRFQDEFGAHVGFVRRYDAAQGRFEVVPQPGENFVPRRYKDDGLEYLYHHIFHRWEKTCAAGQVGMIGEFAAGCGAPHAVSLALLEDYLKMAKAMNMGWALWHLRGGCGVLNSNRKDVVYEDYHGLKLDRKMLELLQRY